MSPVSDGRPLFRPEAVEAHAMGRTARRPLDLRERTTTWAFRGLLATIALAVLLGYTLHANLTAKGVAHVGQDARTATFLMPVGAVRRVHVGQPAWAVVHGHTVRGTVAAVGTPRAVTSGVVVPVSVALPTAASADADATGSGYVRLGHPTLAALLLGKHS